MCCAAAIHDMHIVTFSMHPNSYILFLYVAIVNVRTVARTDGSGRTPCHGHLCKSLYFLQKTVLLCRCMTMSRLH